MSVLIKGMDMPTSCIECRFGYDGKCFAHQPFKRFVLGQEVDCPLIPVQPHGRLIDADALKAMWDDEIARLLEKGIEYLDYHVDTLFSDFKHDVDKMPTIIEAEEGEERGVSTTGTSGCFPYADNCIHRLPCGLCTFLHTLCPLGNVGTVGVNWNEVTCQTGDKEGE